MAALGPSKSRMRERFSALLVLLHLLDGEHVALGGLAGRVADEARRAAHEGDHLVPGLLEAAEHHDGHEVPRLQRGGGGVEAAVHRLRRLQQFLDFGVGHGLHEAARLQFFQQRHLFVSFCLIPLDFRCSSEPCSLFVRTPISIAFMQMTKKDKDLPVPSSLGQRAPRPLKSPPLAAAGGPHPVATAWRAAIWRDAILAATVRGSGALAASDE